MSGRSAVCVGELRNVVVIHLPHSKRRDRMKAIFWDGDGGVIWYKRLEHRTWQMPVSSSSPLELESHEPAMILKGIDLKSARRRIRCQRPVAV